MSDPLRTYTREEEETLALNLKRVSEQVHRGTLRDSEVNLTLLCMLHEHLFQGVRSHAGRVRRRDWGTEHLIFGPNRSVHRDKVVAELEQVFETLKRSVASFDANPEHPQYEEQAFHIAVWAHAQVIRIHPFEDGNGRSTRMLMNWLLVRLGLHPVALDAVKIEYAMCLNEYFNTRDIRLLMDLCLRMYRSQDS